LRQETPGRIVFERHRLRHSGFRRAYGGGVRIGFGAGANVYRLNDAVGSLTAGIQSQISGVFMLALSVGVYAVVYSHFALFELGADDWRVWVAALVAYDFFYYWNHRIDHEVGIFWAAHVVHHQSDRFNLSTALRQPSSGVLLG
jgi:sterol desaturase/sphingolipid hydroxylase (fatty acid hydroxylase superfamily)